MESRISDRMAKLMEQHRVVGLAAAVVKDGRLLWSGSFGWANLAKRLPVTTQTLFRVASISKTVAGTAIMQLAEQGKCDLEDDVSEYIGFELRHPRFKQTPITLKQLMTHTSGLQDEYVRFVVDSRNQQVPTLKLSDWLLPGGPYWTDALWGDYEPGSRGSYLYSNVGSILLATAVERISGERYDQYCKKHLFDELDMQQSTFNVHDITDPGRLAVLYERDERTGEFVAEMDDYGDEMPAKPDYSAYVPGTNGALFSPQGGLRTNVEELSRWLLAHMGEGSWNGKQILRQETARLMHRIHWNDRGRDGLPRQSGLCFHITEELIKGTTLIGHSGNAYGLLSAMYFDADRRWGFIFMMNGMHKGNLVGSDYPVEIDLARLLHESFR